MNNRIKQLALEADQYCRDYVPNWTMDHYNRKFAQLIAAECADVCSNVMDYHAILEKFGVEE